MTDTHSGILPPANNDTHWLANQKPTTCKECRTEYAHDFNAKGHKTLCDECFERWERKRDEGGRFAVGGRWVGA